MKTDYWDFYWTLSYEPPRVCYRSILWHFLFPCVSGSWQCLTYNICTSMAWAVCSLNVLNEYSVSRAEVKNHEPVFLVFLSRKYIISVLCFIVIPVNPVFCTCCVLKYVYTVFLVWSPAMQTWNMANCLVLAPMWELVVSSPRIIW